MFTRIVSLVYKPKLIPSSHKIKHIVALNLNTSTSCLLMSKFAFLPKERTFEDHENLVEPLLAWTRDSENKILFQERREKNEVFKNPQVGPPPHYTYLLYTSVNINRVIRSDVIS